MVLLHLVQQQFLCSQSDPVSPIVVVLERPPPHQGGRAAGDGGLKEDFFLKKIFLHILFLANFVANPITIMSYVSRRGLKISHQVPPQRVGAAESGQRRKLHAHGIEKKSRAVYFFFFQSFKLLACFLGCPGGEIGANCGCCWKCMLGCCCCCCMEETAAGAGPVRPNLVDEKVIFLRHCLVF